MARLPAMPHTSTGISYFRPLLSVILVNRNANYLPLKTQNYHWNATEPEFIDPHELFRKQYEEMFGAAARTTRRRGCCGASSTIRRGSPARTTAGRRRSSYGIFGIIRLPVACPVHAREETGSRRSYAAAGGRAAAAARGLFGLQQRQKIGGPRRVCRWGA